MGLQKIIYLMLQYLDKCCFIYLFYFQVNPDQILQNWKMEEPKWNLNVLLLFKDI